MTQQTYAKLVRGVSYTYGGKVFLAGNWLKVTELEKAHLVKNGVDHVTVEDGDKKIPEDRQKFVFGIGTEDDSPDQVAEKMDAGKQGDDRGTRNRSRKVA